MMDPDRFASLLALKLAIARADARAGRFDPERERIIARLRAAQAGAVVTRVTPISTPCDIATERLGGNVIKFPRERD